MFSSKSHFFDQLQRLFYKTAGVTLVSLIPVATTYAHHSHANLDRTKTVTNRGTVTAYGWRMPHAFLKVEAPNAQGKIVKYSIEMLHPPAMLERGWTKTTLKKGDIVSWGGAPDKNPNRYYTGLTWLEKSDGSRLTLKLQPEVVVPSKDFSGIWSRDLSVPLRYLPPSDWPYTPKARKQVENFKDSQNPLLDCVASGPPKATLLPYPIQIVRPNDQTLLINYEGRNIPRTLHFNQDLAPGKPSIKGHSIARFEDDTLIVETNNFIDDRWGIYTGIDSSSNKHLIERMTLAEDGLTIDIDMVVTDPVFFTEPVTIKHKLRKIADRELVQANCTAESAKMFLEGP